MGDTALAALSEAGYAMMRPLGASAVAFDAIAPTFDLSLRQMA